MLSPLPSPSVTLGQSCVSVLLTMLVHQAPQLTGPLLPPQSLDFESQPVHTVVLEALNKFVDPRFADLGTFRDQAIVRVSVTDVDEPPEFQPPSGLLEVQEDAQVGSLVGVVTARDPDAANRPVR